MKLRDFKFCGQRSFKRDYQKLKDLKISSEKSIFIGESLKTCDFEIYPVIRRKKLNADSGGVLSLNPAGLFIRHNNCYYTYSFEEDLSWLSEILDCE